MKTEEKFKHGGGYMTPYNISYIGREIHMSRYEFASKYIIGKKVLDIACGVGYGSNYLANNGAKLVVGGDISQDAIKYAKTHYYGNGKSNLNFIRIDCETLPYFSNTFEVIVSFETLEHLRRPTEFLSECKRVLVENGGMFICSTPNKGAQFFPPRKPFNPTHVKEFTVKEFSDMMNGFFSDVSIYGQYPVSLACKLIRSGNRLLPFIPMADKLRYFFKPIIYKEPKKETSAETIKKKFEVSALSECSYSFNTMIGVAKP